ncbi:ABC transporter substrate-binding protein [Mycetocola tolaasinivorans]|uniref:ABC transporter substrate-binding protein n=1 Tax=Mycetocola tolaasinivorans TaxID=76635 RepID=A0A3L7A5A3_9MICO|nr:ABC transporter substrate-binding protein [Mycetocola tolaasinivorans]RLP75274.1 ABC transporter substrate-binding protein [Mycetocola tolaasinivorans]
MKKRPVLIGALLTAALALSGCAGGAAAGEAEKPATSGPVVGGNLTVGVVAWIGPLDRQQSSSRTFTNIQVTDSLVDQDPDTGKIVPWLASSWEIENDGARYVFKLRDDVTFSNGEKFDAEAVKLNFDSIIELGKQGTAGQANAYLRGYTGTEVIDPYTVAISFDAPKAGFLQAASEAPLGFVSPSTTKQTIEERANGVIGTGPFVIKDVVKDERLVLSARKDYEWGSTARKNASAPHIDTLTYLVIPESSARIGALTSGSVDAIQWPSSNNIDEVDSEYSVYSRPSAGIVYSLYPNTADPILSQEAPRRAVQRAINRQEIKSVLLDKTIQPATSVVSAVFPTYTDLSDKLSYNPDEVKKILTADGWAIGSDGIWAKNGQRLALSLPFESSENKALFELIQQQLKANGIELDLRQVTGAELQASLKSGDYAFAFGNFTRPDPDAFLVNFVPEYSNLARADVTPELTQLIKDQSVNVDAASRAKQSADIQAGLIDHAISIPLHEAVSVIVTDKKVHDVAFTAQWWAIFGAAWIDQ